MTLLISKDKKKIMNNYKPFFYLADTCWSAFTNITDEEWEYYLHFRKAQGFNTLQINILPQWDASSTDLKYYPFELNGDKFDYEKINNGYFEHAKKMCQKAKDYGFELALVVMWCNYVPGTWASSLYKRGIMPKHCILQYIKMVHATFSKFEPIYVISGDTDFDTEESIEYYVECAKILRELNPSLLMTTHIKGRYTKIPHELLPYLNFYFYQSGHNCENLGMPYLLAEEMRNKYPNGPLINSEPCYEEMGFSRQIYGKWNRYDVRRAAWLSLLSGATAGVTYGAAGIYSWHKTNKTFSATLGEGFAMPKCWQEAIHFEGAWDYGYIKHIFELYQLFDIEPAQDLLLKENSEIRVAKTKDKIIIYVPSNVDLELNMNLTGWKGIAIDLENRYVSPLFIKSYEHRSLISMTYFHTDAIYIITKDV